MHYSIVVNCSVSNERPDSTSVRQAVRLALPVPVQVQYCTGTGTGTVCLASNAASESSIFLSSIATFKCFRNGRKQSLVKHHGQGA